MTFTSTAHNRTGLLASIPKLDEPMRGKGQPPAPYPTHLSPRRRIAPGFTPRKRDVSDATRGRDVWAGCNRAASGLTADRGVGDERVPTGDADVSPPAPCPCRPDAAGTGRLRRTVRARRRQDRALSERDAAAARADRGICPRLRGADRPGAAGGGPREPARAGRPQRALLRADADQSANRRAPWAIAGRRRGCSMPRPT